MPPLASFPYVSVRNHFISKQFALDFHRCFSDTKLALLCSDGSPSSRPNVESSAIQEDGTVDYMDECIGDDPTLNYW